MSDELTPDELLTLRFADGQIESTPEASDPFWDAYYRMKERGYIVYKLWHDDYGQDYRGFYELSETGRAALEAAANG